MQRQQCRAVQKQVFSLWEATTWGYVRPRFLCQFHRRPKKFCWCLPVPGLSMIACREAAHYLTTLALRQSDLSSISLPFPEVFPASPHLMYFVLHRLWWDVSYHPLSLSCCAPRCFPSRMSTEQSGKPACFHQSCLNGAQWLSHVDVFLKSPSGLKSYPPLDLALLLTLNIKLWNFGGHCSTNWASAMPCSSPALFTHPWPVTVAPHQARGVYCPGVPCPASHC